MKALLYIVLFPIMFISGFLGIFWAVVVLPVHTAKVTTQMVNKLTSEVDTL
jgi:hypothetical protein